MNTTIINIGLAMLIAFMGIGCKNKKDEVRNPAGDNIIDQFGIDGKISILQVERPGNLDCICSWQSFLNFGKFDLTDVQSGTLRLKTGVVAEAGIVYDNLCADIYEFNYDKILMGWFNESSVTNLVITSAPVIAVPDPDNPADTIKLFDLEAGVEFQLQNWAAMTNPDHLQFSIWARSTVNSITEYVELQRHAWNNSNVFNINFLKSSFSGVSMQEKQNLAWTTVATTPPTIDLTAFPVKTEEVVDFEAILSASSQDVAGTALKGKDSIPDSLDNELYYVKYCKNNLTVYLTDVLLSYMLNGRPRKYPAVTPALDNNLVLFTNINETVDKVEILGGSADDIVYSALFFPPALFFTIPMYANSNASVEDYMDKLIGSTSFTDVKQFTDLILHYTDYLLYGGLVSLVDPAFRSRYFNNLDAMLVEMANLLDMIDDVFDNNIPIRFYAVAALYDFMKTGDRGYLQTFETLYQRRVGPNGEYGEGYDYNTYVNWIVHPVLYLALQDTFTMGPNVGQTWMNAGSPAVQLCIQNAQRMLEAAEWWGEVPAMDDGFNIAPLLAPMALIANDRKFMHHHHRAVDFRARQMPEQDDIANGYVIGQPDNCLRLITYPFNKTTITNDTPFDPPDSVSVAGSMVKMRVTNVKPGYTERLSLSLTAEADPAWGKTHDQTDHGEIQLSRYVDRGAGNEHVSHMVIDPGYPGFQEDKRHIEEFKFINQNSLMMYNMDITTMDDTLNPNVTIKAVTGEHAIDLPEPFNPKVLGGMSGYKYFSRHELTELARNTLTDTWVISYYASSQAGYSLKSDAGGKSEVVKKFRNGVKTRITYEYRDVDSIKPVYDHGWLIRYEVKVKLRNDCKGYRDVYNLGNSFYVIDRFPAADHPTIGDLDFGTSWNLPFYTDSVAGRPGCFRGYSPRTGTVQSRVQLTCKGFTGTPVLGPKNYTIHRAMTSPPYQLKQAVFENNAATDDFMVTELKVIDGTEAFKTTTADFYALASGRRYWTRTYTDGSSDIVIVNPARASYTYDGITTDAYVLIVNADNVGDGVARLFDCTATATVTAPHTITFQNGGQCDITL